MEKLKRDMEIQEDLDNLSFDEECGRFVRSVERCLSQRRFEAGRMKIFNKD